MKRRLSIVGLVAMLSACGASIDDHLVQQPEPEVVSQSSTSAAENYVEEEVEYTPADVFLVPTEDECSEAVDMNNYEVMYRCLQVIEMDILQGYYPQYTLDVISNLADVWEGMLQVAQGLRGDLHEDVYRHVLTSVHTAYAEIMFAGFDPDDREMIYDSLEGIEQKAADFLGE